MLLFPDIHHFVKLFGAEARNLERSELFNSLVELKVTRLTDSFHYPGGLKTDLKGREINENNSLLQKTAASVYLGLRQFMPDLIPKPCPP